MVSWIYLSSCHRDVDESMLLSSHGHDMRGCVVFGVIVPLELGLGLLHY